MTLSWQLIRPRQQWIQLLCVYISFIICKLWQLRKKMLHVAVNIPSIQPSCFGQRIDHRTCSCSTHGIDQYPVLPADCERTYGSFTSLSLYQHKMRNGLRPYYYFKHVLETMIPHMDDKTTDFLEELMPWSESLPEVCRAKEK